MTSGCWLFLIIDKDALVNVILDINNYLPTWFVKPIISPSYMPLNSPAISIIHARCLYRQFRLLISYANACDAPRAFSSSSALPLQAGQPAAVSEDEAGEKAPDRDGNNSEIRGAMSRRLAEMTDENIEQGGRSAQKAVEESGFSEDLKRQLEQRILDSKFKSDNPGAFSKLTMPVRLLPTQ